jgi:hypothetical protein
MYGNVHGEHPERESTTNQVEGIEAARAAYKPRHAEDNRPRDDDPDYVNEEREPIGSPTQPGCKSSKRQNDSSSDYVFFDGAHEV